MRNLIASLLVSSLLVGCAAIPSFLNPLSSKGGPTVNANVLAGKENTQQVVAQQNQQDAGRDIVTTEIRKEVEAKSVEQIKILNTNIPPWVLLLLLLGWLLPTPQAIGMGTYKLMSSFTKRK
jgi:uncharacterized protein YceK